ncbi:hypothetical protein IHE44_0005212 [Lamprotornis superbus]|uniref:Neurotransmitter-gated ion-channel ligand-binding domain-containing protein n=1 Tax=Lamprotornis superbus TaxID=245042 RepID=A0A835TXS8_9PASS|nr:hypothetical protein IHE44_0005212 [Lamprotornis superbus]
MHKCLSILQDIRGILKDTSVIMERSSRTVEEDEYEDGTTNQKWVLAPKTQDTDVTLILNKLLREYDKKLRPDIGIKPTVIDVDIYVNSIGPVSSINMDKNFKLFSPKLLLKVELFCPDNSADRLYAISSSGTTKQERCVQYFIPLFLVNYKYALRKSNAGTFARLRIMNLPMRVIMRSPALDLLKLFLEAGVASSFEISVVRITPWNRQQNYSFNILAINTNESAIKNRIDRPQKNFFFYHIDKNVTLEDMCSVLIKLVEASPSIQMLQPITPDETTFPKEGKYAFSVSVSLTNAFGEKSLERRAAHISSRDLCALLCNGLGGDLHMEQQLVQGVFDLGICPPVVPMPKLMPSVVLLPVKLLQEASLQNEASLCSAKCQSPGLPTLPAVSQCQPGAVHKDCTYCTVICPMAFAEGATSIDKQFHNFRDAQVKKLTYPCMNPSKQNKQNLHNLF